MSFFPVSQINSVISGGAPAFSQMFGGSGPQGWSAFGNWIANTNGQNSGATPGGVNPNMMMSMPMLSIIACAMFAFDAKPYGPEPNPPYTLSGLLSTPSLACDCYVRLAWMLHNQMPWTVAAGYPEVKIVAVGWNGGSLIGNHAQLLVAEKQYYGTEGNYNWINSTLIDPTAGVIASTTFDKMLRGEACTHWVDMYPNTNGKPVGDPNCMYQFHLQVLQALRQGEYRPSDLMYYVQNITKYNNLIASGNWYTPGLSNPQDVPKLIMF